MKRKVRWYYFQEQVGVYEMHRASRDMVHDMEINLQHIGRYSDDKIIEPLTPVKGIGKWTAQMFLNFALGRPDVFPHDDLGVRSATRKRYDLDELPDVETTTAIAAKWRPYASVASWYCWRSLNIGKASVAEAKG